VLQANEEAENLVAEEVLSIGLAEGETIATVPNVVSDSGVTSAAVVDSAALIEAGEPAEVAVEAPGGGTITASISAEALASVGGNAVILVTAIDESALASFQPVQTENSPPVEQQTKLASLPVSIRLVDESGNKISIADLTEPIEVTLVVENRTSDMVCGWFDEETSEWRTDGVELVDPESDIFLCATTHLTVFGAVIKGALGAIACSNAELLTSKGLSKLGKGDWWHQPGAVLFWVLIVVEVVGMFYISHRSKDLRHKLGWEDSHLLTASTAFDDKSGKEAKKALQDNASMARRGSDASRVSELAADKPSVFTSDGVAQRLTSLVTRLAVASQQNVHQQDLAAILKGGVNHGLLKEAKTRTSAWGASEQRGSLTNQSQLQRQATGMSNVQLVRDVGKKTRSTIADFFKAGFWHRVWIVFNAGNAWISLGNFSFTVPPTTRALLLALRVNSSLFASAFFFGATGASSNEDDDLCSPSNFWENVGRNIVIAMFSIIVGLVPFFIMSYFAYRTFVYKESWDMDTKRRYIRNMKTNAEMLWIFGVLYGTFCAFFVMVFLANVGKGSTLDWITTASTDLMMSIVLEPLVKAIALVLLLDIFMAWKHEVVQKQLAVLELSYEQLLDDEDRSDRAQAVQQRLQDIDRQALPPVQNAGYWQEPPPPGEAPQRMPNTMDGDDWNLFVENFGRFAQQHGMTPRAGSPQPGSRGGMRSGSASPSPMNSTMYSGMRSPAAHPGGCQSPCRPPDFVRTSVNAEYTGLPPLPALLRIESPADQAHAPPPPMAMRPSYGVYTPISKPGTPGSQQRPSSSPDAPSGPRVSHERAVLQEAAQGIPQDMLPGWMQGSLNAPEQEEDAVSVE